MRVLFTSLRNTSHFLPLIPFIEGCRRRGHEVAVAAPEGLGERVAATGAAFLPFGHPGDEGLRPLWMKMRDVSDDEANRIAIGEIFAGICARTALPGLFETLARFRPDVVIRESQEYAALLACEKLGVAHARVAITLRTAEMRLLSAAAPALDVHRAGTGMPLDPAGERVRREPALTLFPGSLEPPELRVPEVQRFRAARKPAAPLPDHWNGRREPLVYATLGTVTGARDNMRATYRVLLDALAGLPARVLLTIGAELPLEELGTIPAGVHVERFVPQDEVLAHAALCVCHGGSGTVLGALAAGVPLVITPLFADQPDNAARVAAVGAGLGLPIGNAPAAAQRQAIERVLADASFRSTAQRIAAEIAALPSIDDAALAIERLAHS
jgi:UDP:flavonoid glycosyltransferase YjiC (YdhE family)